MKIAVVIGSTRPGRLGEKVARWVMDAAQGREGVTYELVDVDAANLPLLDEAVPAAMGQYTNEHTKAWAATIAQYDGFVFVTPEYNHSVSGALKNAFDYLAKEWYDKAIGFVSYGADGGVRAVEHWRTIVANAHMADVRAVVSLGLFTDVENGEIVPLERRAGELAAVFDQVERWAGALAPLRG